MSEIQKTKADQINELHGELTGLVKATVDKAIEIGGLLHEQKQALPHGEWIPWVRENLAFSERWARDYMRFYRERDKLKTANVADLSDARALLTERQQPEEPRQADPHNTNDIHPENSAIAGLLGNHPKIRVTDVGLIFREPLTESEWTDLVERCKYLNIETDAAKWIMGDLMSHGIGQAHKAHVANLLEVCRRYHEMKATEGEGFVKQYARENSESYRELMKRAAIGEQFERLSRLNEQYVINPEYDELYRVSALTDEEIDSELRPWDVPNAWTRSVEYATGQSVPGEE